MNTRLRFVIAAAIALPALSGCATQVAAAKTAAAEARGAPEKCFGVARAGHNDCRTQHHVCAGWARRDRDPGAFVFVPAGTCSRITGGSTEEGEAG
jgi:uncharacterized membrane protein